MDTESSVHLEGYLQKHSAGPVKSLKKKWFVLRDQEFKMYNTPNDAVSKVTCQDMVYVHDIQGVRKLSSGSSSRCTIEIVSRFKKYTLVAPNSDEQDKWINGFHNAMRNIRMRSSSSPPVFDKQQTVAYNTPTTPPAVRRKRAESAAEYGKSSSQKKRLLSDSWLGKKLRIKSASLEEQQLDSSRQRHSSAQSNYSADSQDRDHIYDIVSEFKTIDEGNDADKNSSDEEVFDNGNDVSREPGHERYSPVAPDKCVNVDIVREDKDFEKKVENLKPLEVDNVDEYDPMYDPLYIGETNDGGVEELRKMIRDSGLEFDDTWGEDDYEKIETDDAPAMAQLREMLKTM